MGRETLHTLKDYNINDTIAAIATFPAKSALGVIKVSGKRAIPIVSQIFVPKKKDIKKAKSYTLHYGWIREKLQRKNCKGGKSLKENERILDEVLVSIMKAPYTYTREDVVEISSHGGLLVLNKILELLLERGARLAYPGEFTYRAVVNGRIDLLQAQSVLDIVEAKTEESLAMAVKQLRGEASNKLKELRDVLQDTLVNLEACLQFPEEDVTFSIGDIKEKIKKLREKTEELIRGCKAADTIKEGVRCVICGKANSGKSTLFNCLLKEERAIVTRIKGTTRDVVEEVVNIKGVPLRICDTAGVLEPRDLIQKKALEKSYQAVQTADIILFLLDYARPLEEDDFFLLDKVKNKSTIIIINKIDLKQRLDLEVVKGFNKPTVKVSALKSIGLNRLEKTIFNYVYRNGLIKKDAFLSLSQWQKEILKEMLQGLRTTEKYINESYPLDFINFSLEEVMHKLGKLAGEFRGEEILREIFSHFCIGK